MYHKVYTLILYYVVPICEIIPIQYYGRYLVHIQYIITSKGFNVYKYKYISLECNISGTTVLL